MSDDHLILDASRFIAEYPPDDLRVKLAIRSASEHLGLAVFSDDALYHIANSLRSQDALSERIAEHNRALAEKNRRLVAG